MLKISCSLREQGLRIPDHQIRMTPSQTNEGVREAGRTSSQRGAVALEHVWISVRYGPFRRHVAGRALPADWCSTASSCCTGIPQSCKR